MAFPDFLLAWMGWRGMRAGVRQMENPEQSIHVCVREAAKAGRGIANDPFVLVKPPHFIDADAQNDTRI
jgi:hypothetical protein